MHERNRGATGTPMLWGNCRSGNVLFRRRLFLDHGEFDTGFAASGGEDCDFFWRCMEQGARLVWCDEAIVHEAVPAERMTRRWLLRRAYNGGRSFARLRAKHRGWPSFLLDAAWGAMNVVVSGVPAALTRAVGMDRAFTYERKVAGGVGKIMAPFAGTHGEYGKHGPKRQVQ